MERYIVNKTLITISVDSVIDKPVSTIDMFTPGIKDQILERLDEILPKSMGDIPAVCVTLSIEQQGLADFKEQEIDVDQMEVQK